MVERAFAGRGCVVEPGVSIRRVLLIAMLAFPLATFGAKRLTVADALNATRAFDASVGWWASEGRMEKRSSQGVFVSPDRTRYALMLVRGDLERNGNWLELLAGSLESLETTIHPRTVARMFMSSLGSQYRSGTSALSTGPTFNQVFWLDNRRLAVLWGDERNTTQVYVVDIVSATVRQWTRSPTDVLTYAVGRDGTLVYTALANHGGIRSRELIDRGYAVNNFDLTSVLQGHADGYGMFDFGYNSEVFLLSRGARARKISLSDNGADFCWATRMIEFSPDGKRVIIDGSPVAFPARWRKYSGFWGDPVGDFQRAGFNSFAVRFVRQLFVVDIVSGSSHKLWDAPGSSDVAWSPDGRSVLVGPTYLPPDEASDDGLRGAATAEVDAASGTFSHIPIPAEALNQSIRWRWISRWQVEADAAGARFAFRKVNGIWMQTSLGDPRTSEDPPSRMRIELRQGLNTPPTLVAVDTLLNREQTVIDLNPQLRGFDLGRVEHVRWVDKSARSWSGLLYHPVNYTSDHRYPLVIQTHGYAPVTEFSLTGLPHGMGPSGGPYAAQVLTNRGIAVLQVEDKDVQGVTGTPQEATLHADGYESAIEHFVSIGIADQAKVGLAGFSRTGWYVQHALTHSSAIYAAAVVCCQTEPSYISSAEKGWWYESEADMGAKPFSEGLIEWLENAPAFNADRIVTPLQLQASFGYSGVLQSWEMFSRLRHLGKPIELYVIPQVDRGSHPLQNPRQLLDSQQRAVDWFLFWLNGVEDSDVKKREQYLSWRQLRQRHQSSAGVSRRPLLKWSATPLQPLQTGK